MIPDALTPAGRELLRRGADDLGLDVAPHEEQFARLLALLRAGNERLNLTALKTEEDIVLKHFVDSLTTLRGGHLDGEWKTLDLGTGAGFPALPLAILRPELWLTPLDSIRKKIDFVRETAAELGLSNVTPQVGRAETLGQSAEHREGYDRVVARAVAALPVLAELALPLLRVGGVFVAQKGPLSEEELDAGRRAAGEVGGRIIEVDPFTLPVSGDARTLIVLEKQRPTPAKYPRREGVPTHQPLFWKAKEQSR
ncbi:16S rRNA (guanine(527)-N(7))-methyltransferase RsmG [Deinococcus sp. PESE-13]